MRDIKNNLQISDIWTIQLTVAINFSSSKDAEGKRVIHSKSNNIASMSYDNVNEVVNEHFELLLLRFKENLETSIEGSDFIFDST